jgi:hypothetical protein
MTIGANGKMDEVAFYDLVDKKISVLSSCPWCSTSKYYWWTREKFKLILMLFECKRTDYPFPVQQNILSST